MAKELRSETQNWNGKIKIPEPQNEPRELENIAPHSQVPCMED